MRLVATPLPGAYVVEPDRIGDERGWFARTYDAAAFAERGLQPVGVQCNASFNARRDTLRGMHLQAPPHGEAKLVRCVRGAIFDVGVDLREGSPARLAWHGVELSADNGLAFYLPAGLAHGFQTLTDDCEVLYMMGHEYVPGAAAGARWDDPALAIAWPEPHGERTISAKDRAYPDVAS
jgi:dTDP-4-dehydrorhamnose 3,5-epimerase